MERRTWLRSLVIVATFLAACQSNGAGVDRAGGETLVLQLATIDSVNNNGQSYGPQAFVDGLGEVSDGRLRVEVIEVYGDGAADAESRLVQAIAAGDLDGGWPSTRAFAGAEIPGLEVVEAPMTITSYAAEKDLVSGPVADELLARLDGTGIKGLALAVGPLRRPFTADGALLDLEDWEGQRFRVYNSPTQDRVVRALGARPVNLGFEWIDEIRAGSLRGAEFDVAQYEANGFTDEAPNVTANVVLWPKVFVLSISQERWDSMTEQQRDWVVEAAERASQASVDATYDESTLARGLCERGVRFPNADDGQIAELRTALTPIFDEIAEDALFEDLLAIASDHPTEQPDVPASCTNEAEGAADAGAVPNEVSDIPEGTYRAEISESDVADAGLSNADGWSGTWTLTIEEGTWQLSCRPLDLPGRDCGNAVYDGPLEAGQVRGTGNTVHVIGSDELMASLTGCELPASSAPGHCAPVFSYVLTWDAAGDELELIDAGSVDAAHVFTIERWTRID